jgi:DNA-binding XRE family transcriptional regulator
MLPEHLRRVAIVRDPVDVPERTKFRSQHWLRDVRTIPTSIDAFCHQQLRKIDRVQTHATMRLPLLVAGLEQFASSNICKSYGPALVARRTVRVMARSGFGKRFPARNSLMAKTLARNVRRLRKEKGWTQDELAAKVKIEQTAVSLIENGRANPTLQTLEAVAASLGVRFTDLFDTRPQK